MTNIIRVHINTEVEAYPVLAIYPRIGTSENTVEIPEAMYEQLAWARVEQARAEIEIMRYVAEHTDRRDVRDWLSDNAE